MPTTGSVLFIHLVTQATQRRLHSAIVVEVAENFFTAEIDETDLEAEAGQRAILYFEHEHKFLQQPARIGAVLKTSPKTILGIETTGEPGSAESRECFRVSASMVDLRASIAAGETCPVLEVSATGFAMISAERFGVGAVLGATLYFEDTKFVGKASIQGVRELGPDRIRYGLDAIDDRRSGGNLQKGLQQITMSVQRAQLRRLKRVG